ncbi:GvpL/GvpF family gas vesicle protein [Streptomyces sp. 8N706]|uniref:GvpL/GvpF family gas vesicle protein n=1 Tax=Streptomyces sp. 8N706 TaxID=3457416 RepID=UPI003FD2A736
MTEPLEYAYAVVRAADRLPEDLQGVGGAPVTTVVEDGIAAVVSPVPAADFEEEPLRAHLEDMRWLELTARSHQQVVDAVAAMGCALPLRLATVCRGEEGVRRMLAADRERFESAFAALDGRDEWGVKMYADIGPDSGADGSAAVNGTARPSSGRDYLRLRQQYRRAREDSRRQAEDGAREAHEALSGLAEHTRLHRPQDAQLSGATGQNILNGAYLVPREDAGAFAALVGELADRAVGLRVELTGPWAPYSFTGVASGPGGDASSAEELR